MMPEGTGVFSVRNAIVETMRPETTFRPELKDSRRPRLLQAASRRGV